MITDHTVAPGEMKRSIAPSQCSALASGIFSEGTILLDFSMMDMPFICRVHLVVLASYHILLQPCFFHLTSSYF